MIFGRQQGRCAADSGAESGTMDVRQLRQFLAVVDHGTVHRAAEHLIVAQPSVTQTIRRLGAELGTKLFIRRGRGLVLSPWPDPATCESR